MQSIDKTFYVRDNCFYFTGAKPCKFWRACMDCEHFQEVDMRILVVMLIKLGDVLILSPLLKKLKEQWPKSHITWLADESVVPLVKMNPYVSRILPYSWRSICQLRVENYDLVLGYEREPAAAALVHEITAKSKVGEAYGGKDNSLYILNEPATHFFKMNTWNDYRVKNNDKTWTELYFEIAGFTYKNEPYILDVPQNIVQLAQDRLKVLDSSKIKIGLNIGGSLVTKIWPVDAWEELAKRLLSLGYCVIFIGGPSDVHNYDALEQIFVGYRNDQILFPGCNNSMEDTCALIKHFDVVVSGDTFIFHVALAFDISSVILFGPSNPSEVVPKHKSNITIVKSPAKCSPCADQIQCRGSGGCMELIPVETVLTNIEECARDQEGKQKR